jgi:anti-sigma factor RsiW
MMCDSEQIVSYLYDELGSAERRSFERHLASCEACRVELAGLRQARTTLNAWTPPELDLGFEIVQRPPRTATRRWAFPLSPAWGGAAAAVLVLAAASAIANLEVQVGGEGLVVRTGWNRTAPATPATDTTAVSAQSVAQPSVDLAALTKRLGDIEAALAARPAVSTPVPSSGSQADVLRQVRQLIDDNYKRQQSELALMIGQVHRDVDIARRADFVRFQQALAQVQGNNDAQVLWQRQVEDRLLRVVQQQR